MAEAQPNGLVVDVKLPPKKAAMNYAKFTKWMTCTVEVRNYDNLQ